MAIFLLCFDACSDECSHLIAFLRKHESSRTHPSSREIAPGTWAVVEPSDFTAQRVLGAYRQHLSATQKLSVIGIDCALDNRKQNLQVDGAFLHWADQWKLIPWQDISEN